MALSLPPDQQNEDGFGHVMRTFWRMITEDSRSMLRGYKEWTTDRTSRTFALAEMGRSGAAPYLPGLRRARDVPCPYWDGRI